jgi:hypothetical protein
LTWLYYNYQFKNSYERKIMDKFIYLYLYEKIVV